MDIKEYLDEEADARATFEEVGELGSSVLKISLIDGVNEVRIYPYGIKKLKELLDFIDKNNLVKD